MNAPKNISKDSLKELYNESKKRIKMMLQLLARSSKDNQFSELPDEQNLTTMFNLSEHILNAAKMENDNQYKDAIIYIADWIHMALHRDFLQKYQNHHPHPLFIVKKGAEILHSFLHRDLRRKQFSSEESEIYQNYLALIRRLPNPKG